MKRILLGVFTILASFAFIGSVSAASASISVRTNKSQVAVGSTVRVTVNVSSSAALGSWQYTLNYDSSMFSLVSSDVAVAYADVASNGSTRSKSYSYNFRAKKSGTGTFKIINSGVIGWDEKKMSVSNGSRSVKALTQSEIEASYSKNNYLKSLSVNGATLNPSFNKETLEYSVTLDPDTKKISISAQKDDSTASVSGAGEITLTEGLNKIVISVTAQNGNVRKYTINATVQELSPIEVVVNNEPFSVVRKADALEKPSTYNDTTISIHGEDVPAFYSEITKYTLVGLKNSTGDIALYIYDEKRESYTLYEELNLKGVIFNSLETKNIPSGYEKSTITINDYEIDCYILNKDSKFVLLYGINVENGNEGFYVYDKEENTLQRYNTDLIETYENKANTYLIVAASFGGLLVLTILLTIVSFRKNKPKKIKYDTSKATN